jgi:hypothetical protein
MGLIIFAASSLASKYSVWKKNYKPLIGASYKGKLSHFEISVKWRIFVPISTYLKKRQFGRYLVN